MLAALKLLRLFQFTFQNPMKVYALNFVGLDDGIFRPAYYYNSCFEDSAPCSVKLFVNRTGMGFDDTDSIEATQEFTLGPEDLNADTMTKLRFVRFQKCTTLTVNVPTCHVGIRDNFCRSLFRTMLVQK